MLKSSLILLTVSSLALATGCSEDDKGNDGGDNGGNNRPSKPLPNDCLSTLNVDIRWGDDPDAFKYQIDVGYQKGGAAETYILDTPKSNFEIEMDRGAHYFYRLTRVTGNNRTEYRDLDLMIPTCDDRKDYKEAHPEYNEPPVLTTQW